MSSTLLLYLILCGLIYLSCAQNFAEYVARLTPTSNNGPYGLVRVTQTSADSDTVDVSWELTPHSSGTIGALHIHQVESFFFHLAFRVISIYFCHNINI